VELESLLGVSFPTGSSVEYERYDEESTEHGHQKWAVVKSAIASASPARLYERAVAIWASASGDGNAEAQSGCEDLDSRTNRER